VPAANLRVSKKKQRRKSEQKLRHEGSADQGNLKDWAFTFYASIFLR